MQTGNKIYSHSFTSNKLSKIVAPICPVATFALFIQPDIGFVKKNRERMRVLLVDDFMKEHMLNN